MPEAFVSKRAALYKDVPDEKWNDWRWQLSNRLNSAEDFEQVLPLTDSERRALNSSGLFRVDITPTSSRSSTRTTPKTQSAGRSSPPTPRWCPSPP
jgi:L-lysine 2,3-aminomutase